MEQKFQLDRATYKQIKSMDKARMAAFLSDIYMSGKEESGSAELDFDKLREEIAQIKGIGESRLNEIMAVIEKHLLGEAPAEE
ncbi:MAG: hypothetical protein IJ385_01290 [Ruminiclostridium sp.]|nr:hypothetical protein [Ruminiclostridium sp.]